MAVKRFYFFGSYSSAPTFRPFIIQINSGADGTFTIPTFGGGYNYKVSTSDGQNFTGVTGNLTITFPDANTLYDISISGDFPMIFFNNTGDKDKLIDIKQWGDIEWTSMERAFFGCSNTTCTATDAPIASNGVSLNCEIMFSRCNNINFDLASWNLTISGSAVGFLHNANEFDSNGNDAVVTLLGTTGSLFSFMQYTKVKKVIIYGCENLSAIDNTFTATGTFRGSNDLVGVELHGMKVNLNIRPTFMTVNGLTGTAIDNLANSVADMTGQTSPTVTMTTAQYNSCDTSIWTNKNWTIAQV